jgi:hypothetical protein
LVPTIVRVTCVPRCAPVGVSFWSVGGAVCAHKVDAPLMSATAKTMEKVWRIVSSRVSTPNLQLPTPKEESLVV